MCYNANHHQQAPCSPLLVASGSPGTSLTHELRDVLQHCGILPQHYFSHSFRIGAATTAAAAGIPAWLIKVLGRWSSDCYERYIRTPQETLLAIPKQLSMNCSTNCRLDRSLLST